MISITNPIRKNLLPISIGIVYIWFGLLKFSPGLSPAEDLAKQTIHILFFGLIPSDVSILLLAIWETIIGVFLIANICRKITVSLALLHITLTFSPLFLLPDQVFNGAPFMLTLVGQYIIKNFIIIAVLISIYKESRKTG